MTPERAIARVAVVAIPALVLCARVAADPVTVTLAGSFVQSVTAGGQTIDASLLTSGISTGAADLSHPSAYSINAADGANLGFYFARSSQPGAWQIDLGSWNDTNAGGHDFFLFEAGGNDNIQVAPLFPGGGVGQPVDIGGWTSTGFQIVGGPNHNQIVHGLAFKSTQLKRPNGTAVTNSDVLSGLRVYSSTIDGAGFLAVDPHPATGVDGNGSGFVVGDMRKWRPVKVCFRGPWANESDSNPNPFLDRRLNVTFEGPQGQSYVVPGFFDGDGTGSGSGNLWCARFTPDGVGQWRATASFRGGPQVAISLSPSAGSALQPLNGSQVVFDVIPADSAQTGLWRWGWLEYGHGHYPKFRQGPYFIKGGVNSPENILAYRGFEEVSDAGGIGILHRYQSHIADWNPTDPNFRSNVYPYDGRALIGALNYLASEGVNSVFAMVMNLGGDGQDVHPFLGNAKTAFNKTHYDIGRMKQWNAVFEHAADKGIAMHFGLAETETANEQWLDNGGFGVERKLFFRELVARFAHVPAIKWTLCEENDFSTPLLRQFADYIDALDVYDHAVTFHNHPNNFQQYNEVAGEDRFQATSCQYDYNAAGDQVEQLRATSAAAGNPWVVQMDENNPYQTGLSDTNSAELRKRVLYDVLFSGGHIEWYFGWYSDYPGGDLTVEDFRTREDMYRYMRYAREFLQDNVPFWEMEPMDSLVNGEAGDFGGAEVFAKPGQVYAIYLPKASPSGTLDLSGASGGFVKRWFNPRSGQFQGTPVPFTAGSSHALGSPPNTSSEDWVVLVAKEGGDFSSSASQASVSATESVVFGLTPGPAYAGRSYILLGSFTGTHPGFNPSPSVHVPLNFDRYLRFTLNFANSQALINTSGRLDSAGRATARIRFLPGVYGPLVGTTLHHGYLLLDPADYASGALPVTLLP